MRASLDQGIRWTSRAVAVALLLVFVGCKEDGLSGVTAALRFEPREVEFDVAYADGQVRTEAVAVINDSRASLVVRWSSLELPFSAQLPEQLPPGASTLLIEWTPTVEGRFSQVLEVSAEGVKPASLALDASARAMPTCLPSSPCVTSRFDLTQQRCVEEEVGDGTACDPGTACLLDATCQAGRCVGTARTCDDQNRCTIDVCYPLTGCEFLPAPPCPGDGLCQDGACHPERGCELTPARDGTVCGPVRDCTSAQVCITGQCVERDPPDGFVCRERTPCEAGGRCVNDQCVTDVLETPPPSNLLTTWRFDTVGTGDLDAGVPDLQLHDFVLEPSGAMTLSGFFHVGAQLRANTPQALQAPEGPSRRCILWNGRLVCADYPATPNGKVSMLDLSTGETLWTFDLRTERPDFLMLTSTLFMARLVVQGSDRLTALFEAYPLNARGDTQCRLYFLVVLNARGELIQAQQLVDPLLAECNHPHPYGAASDQQGNLFLAFSPSVSQHAPLVPDTLTLLMSYSRDGLFRWKRLNQGMRGGELGVARGLLYPENTAMVLNATSGATAFTLPELLGRAVVSRTRLVPAPVSGSATLAGYEAGVLQRRWVHALPAGWTFWSDHHRLATWCTSRGERTVVLSFVEDNTGQRPQHHLYGLDAHSGATAFTCPVQVETRTPPQLFEVAEGSVGVMGGALDIEGKAACARCDPPFAGSSAAFFQVATDTLTMPDAPWPGTFGGAGHDHQED